MMKVIEAVILMVKISWKGFGEPQRALLDHELAVHLWVLQDDSFHDQALISSVPLDRNERNQSTDADSVSFPSSAVCKQQMDEEK